MSSAICAWILLSFNIRSVYSNLKKILHDFHIFNLNVVDVCKPKLTDNPASLYNIQSYKIFTQNRSSNGVGVLLCATSQFGALKFDELCVTKQKGFFL